MSVKKKEKWCPHKLHRDSKSERDSKFTTRSTFTTCSIFSTAGSFGKVHEILHRFMAVVLSGTLESL